MYERFFGLVDAPFRLTPDPRYLFLSPKHTEALAHLKLGLREYSGFVCITGEVGAGNDDRDADNTEEDEQLLQHEVVLLTVGPGIHPSARLARCGEWG